MMFKVGDKVLIIGDNRDATDHLDGKIGEVTAVTLNDILVTVEGDRFPWWIWNYNAKLID